MNKKVFLLLQLKRIGKNTGLLILFLAFFCSMLFISGNRRSAKNERITVGLFLSNDDPLSVSLYHRLLQKSDSLFSFEQAASQEELQRKVITGSYECGYWFNKPLLSLLDRQQKQNLVTVFVSENTTCKGILNELVYAEMFEEYSLHLAILCMKEDDLLPFTKEDAALLSLPPVTEKRIAGLYQTYRSNGETFQINVSGQKEDRSPLSAGNATKSLSHGLTAIFLFLCGFLALLTLIQDQENGRYLRYYGTTKHFARFLTELPILLSGCLVSFAALFFSEEGFSPFRELVSLLLYALLLILFFSLIHFFVRDKNHLYGMFPVLFLCTILFTNVFTDISTIFPFVRVLRMFLPTHYYLFLLNL